MEEHKGENSSENDEKEVKYLKKAYSLKLGQPMFLEYNDSKPGSKELFPNGNNQRSVSNTKNYTRNGSMLVRDDITANSFQNVEIQKNLS